MLTFGIENVTPFMMNGCNFARLYVEVLVLFLDSAKLCKPSVVIWEQRTIMAIHEHSVGEPLNKIIVRCCKYAADLLNFAIVTKIPDEWINPMI